MIAARRQDGRARAFARASVGSFLAPLRLAAIGCLGFLGFLALGALSQARAEEKFTVAIYAPNAPFESGEARYSFISRLAAQIATATGLPTESKAYVRASDFEAAVKKGQVDFAVLDGVYLAERGVPYPVLAVASAGGDTSSRWWLLANDALGVLDLEGKRIAVPATSGRDTAFVDNVLLDGELPKLFGARQATPDVASAVAAVSLHKADAVFAPEAASKGLKRIFDAGKVPNPALVTIKPGLAKDLVDKVKSAALGHGGTSVYEGWKSGESSAYRSLAARLGSRVRRPVMADPPAVSLEPMQALSLPPLDSAAPDLRAQFWVPPGTP